MPSLVAGTRERPDDVSLEARGERLGVDRGAMEDARRRMSRFGEEKDPEDTLAADWLEGSPECRGFCVLNAVCVACH